MLGHPLLLRQKREEERRQVNDREARTDLHASFMLASDGTSAAGRLGGSRGYWILFEPVQLIA